MELEILQKEKREAQLGYYNKITSEDQEAYMDELMREMAEGEEKAREEALREYNEEKWKENAEKQQIIFKKRRLKIDGVRMCPCQLFKCTSASNIGYLLRINSKDSLLVSCRSYKRHNIKLF